MVEAEAEADVQGGSDASDSGSEPETDPSKLKESFGTISRMSVSPDGQWLATTDSHRLTHIFNLDSIQHHALLPSFALPVQAMTFSSFSPSPFSSSQSYPLSHPHLHGHQPHAHLATPTSTTPSLDGGSSLLVLIFPNHTMEIYDVERKTFPGWAREFCKNLPRRFSGLHDAVLGVAVAPDGNGAGTNSMGAGVLFMWGATWICKVQLDAPIGWSGFNKKRRRKANQLAATQGVAEGQPGQQREGEDNFKLVTHYRPILYAGFLERGELVVVERPLVDVLAKLPPAYFKPKYGVS